MQLKGTKEGWLYYIIGHLMSPYNEHDISIKFSISITTKKTIISPKDATNIKLQFGKLRDRISSEGSIPRKVIPNTGLLFKFNQSAIIEYFEEIEVQVPKVKNRDEEQEFLDVNSILGLDFLTRYKLNLTDTDMVLEK